MKTHITPIAQSILILCLLFSCSPKKTLTGTEREIRDSTIIREIPVEVIIPAASAVSPEINYLKLDSMIRAGVSISLINAMLKGAQNPQSKLSARIKVDEQGNLKAICELQEQLIEVMNKEIERLRIETTTNTVEVSKRWYQEVWDDFKVLIVGAAIILVLMTFRKFIPPFLP